MCKNATATAAALMTAIEPDLKSLLNLLGIGSTPDGQAAITAYDAALAQVKAWVPGTTAQTVVEAINAFTEVFNVLPIPADAKTLVNLVVSGVDAVIAVLTANSPAPTTASETPEVSAAAQQIHAHTVAVKAEEKIASLTDYRPSVVTKAKIMLGDHGAIAGQWKSQWKKAVQESDPKYAALAGKQ
jgi:hypothetical protein